MLLAVAGLVQAIAMIGRRVVISLDAAGAVIDVEDRAAVWAAQIDRIAATLAGPKAGARAMTVAQQRNRIGDMISPLVGSDLLSQGVRAVRAVSLSARSRDGTPTVLSESEVTTRTADGLLVFERSLSGDGQRAHVLRKVDPTNGLVREFVDTTEITVAAGPLKVVRWTVISP